MKAILDTHCWLWWVLEPSKLGSRIRPTDCWSLAELGPTRAMSSTSTTFASASG